MQQYNNPALIRPDRELPRRIGVIGAGTIGPDIGYYLKSAIPGLNLVLIDISPDALDRAVDRIHAYADKGVARGKLTPEQAEGVRQNLTISVDYGDLYGCDWVIEAATENIELKKQIFSRVEDIAGRDCMITSNTSSIPAHSLFSHLRHPGRTTVTHFFAPAFRNPVVEVIDWEQADAEFIRRLRRLFYVTGKVPMVTRDVVCFMLDRIFDNWCNEAGFLLAGATPAQVDHVAGSYVHAGPFFVLNMSNGNPIIIETNSLQAELEGNHYLPADIFHEALDTDNSGHPDNSADNSGHPQFEDAGQKWDESGKWLTIKPGESTDVPQAVAAEIRDRLLGVLFSQTVDILDRDIGAAADLELGCRLAFAFRQGPLELMRELGEQESERILGKFCAQKPGMPGAQRPLRAYQDFHRFILVDELDGVKIITLRRPEALNAIHDDMTDEILALLKQYENDPHITGFVITGYGVSAFSAGADIGRFPSMLGDREQCLEYARVCSRLLVYLDNCSKPVVAALNGMALGGGLELAIRCHGIVAVKDAWLQFPEITLGIAPGIGGMVIPYRRWPDAAAAFHGMLLKAEKMAATAALELKVIDRLAHTHEALLPDAIRRVGELAGKRRESADAPVSIAPPPAIENKPRSFSGQRLSAAVSAVIHQAVSDSAAAASLDEALELGYAAFAESAATAAAREGIAAFMEKRKPEFTD
ncbi:MAG: 3-hydroxyacyl-CoA dehydrogenase NAD-binding domain-containing protein [Gammaproteobacteria bacterium]|nr:3-hydroxyacyl-CoA dehydrogenase NAD-binding domain-containing protein [Gammaproteobacteria bacterium]